MKLYNTLTRKLEPFRPLQGNTARVYSCGPTVYDHAHIGNLSAYIYSDTLQRTLQLAGYDVVRAMNFTDVDDKTIRRSREQYPALQPLAALTKLTQTYTKIFMDDMRRIGNDTGHVRFLRATDPAIIGGMRELIQELHASGFAYIADDGVYFSIEAYRKSGKVYGQLSPITAADTAQSRIQNDEYDKASVHDFALWKTQKPGEPAWAFTLDGHDLTGRPGWHIECSVMSRAALGQPFDIHTGGVDHIFPHHENEIAQSTAGKADPLLARWFVHSEHLMVDGKKMAKSAHNFYTLEDVAGKGFDPLAFRLKVLQSHYRSPANFTWESLGAARNLLHELQAWADRKHQPHAHAQGEAAKTTASSYARALKAMLAAMQNDLDTPAAIAALAQLASGETGQIVDAEKIQPLLNTIDRLFGLQLAARPDITGSQKGLIAGREQARQAKDWQRADELRSALAMQKIGVRDTPYGPVWFRLAS